jgi:hypothetical protein
VMIPGPITARNATIEARRTRVRRRTAAAVLIT